MVEVWHKAPEMEEQDDSDPEPQQEDDSQDINDWKSFIGMVITIQQHSPMVVQGIQISSLNNATETERQNGKGFTSGVLVWK